MSVETEYWKIYCPSAIANATIPGTTTITTTTATFLENGCSGCLYVLTVEQFPHSIWTQQEGRKRSHQSRV